MRKAFSNMLSVKYFYFFNIINVILLTFTIGKYYIVITDEIILLFDK
jgi:hypothetical protein